MFEMVWFLLFLASNSLNSSWAFSKIPTLPRFPSHSRHTIEPGSAAEIGGTLIEAFPLFKEALKLFPEKVMKVRSLYPDLSTEYVSRPDIEEQLIKVYNRKTTDPATKGLYTVVVGCKGSGKTSCVTSVFQKRDGVIFLQVNQEETSASILKRMLESCDFVVESDLNKQLIELQKPFLIAAKNQNDRQVTVIIEVERGTDSQDVLGMVRPTAKQLALFANVIVVIPEADAGLTFGDDPRQIFLWVDEMKQDEAKSLMKKLVANITDEEFDSISSSLGTLPIMIQIAAEEILSGSLVDDVIEEGLRKATDELNAFELKPILKELINNPEGVRTSAPALNQEFEGILLSAPKQVAISMKKANGIVYHIPSGQYRPATGAHKTVLKERKASFRGHFSLRMKKSTMR